MHHGKQSIKQNDYTYYAPFIQQNIHTEYNNEA